MSKIDIRYPDDTRKAFEEGMAAGEILASWKKDAVKDAVAARLNDRLIDLSSPVTENGTIDAVDVHTPEGVGMLRHSISHVMAEAVQELFPNVKVTIGPSIEDGFYYDFDYESTFTPEDLKKIEERMAEIAAKDEPFTRREVSREEAVELFKKKGEPYKVELINDLPADVKTVSLYTQGDFTDLCRGPHIPATGKIKAFKLLNVAGAYWRGDEHNKMLQRIYGTGFATPKEMEEYFIFIEEAKRRDHRRLGKELDLFQINEEVGPGLIIWHPKGAMLRTIIEDWETQRAFQAGLRYRPGAADPQGSHVDPFGPHGPLQGIHVFHRGGRSGLRDQAHELPLPHDDLQIEDPQLSGPAASLLRTGDRAPPREDGRAPRSDPRAAVHPG